MARNFLLTISDVENHLLDVIGMDAGSTARQTVRRAILSAMRALNLKHTWSYYWQIGKLNTVASYFTGAVSYDHTGGSSERLVTLSTGTFPTWASYGTLQVGDNFYEVDQRVDGTHLTLSRTSNPGADFSSRSYYLFRDTYPLPTDFLRADQVYNMTSGSRLEYCHVGDWQASRASGGSTVGEPWMYTFRGDPNYFGQLAISLSPPPGSIYTLDFPYQRNMRGIAVAEYRDGTVTTTSASTTVSGSGTAFTSSMAGAVIRFASSSTDDHPTGNGGLNPAVVERVISSVDSATSLTVDSAPGYDLTGVKYVISDPIDIDAQIMTNYFLRECEKQLRTIRRIKEVSATEEHEYQRTLLEAIESDSRSVAPAWVGTHTRISGRSSLAPDNG